MSLVADHLMQLVRIPSTSNLSNRSVIDYAAHALHGFGWTTREDVIHDTAGVEKLNLICAPRGQDVALRLADLAFFCHTDTVPFAETWICATDPYIEKRVLYGRGACDVKGFLACLLTAAEAVGDRSIDGLRFVLTADEEIGCLGTARLLARQDLRSRRIVVGEPTNLAVARAGKGYCLARVTVRGKEAHSAHPAQGASAIYAASAIVARLEAYGRELEAQRNELFAPAFTTLNVGTIQGGTAKNIVAGACEFLVEWRPVPHPNAPGIASAIEQLAQAEAAARPGITCDVSILRQQQGFETPITATLVNRIQTLTGVAPMAIPFGSEASLLAAISDEIVVFGPGDMRVAHSERECIALDQLDAATSVIEDLMQNPIANERRRP